MRGTLKRKMTREVHGEKICRLRIDIPYSEVHDEGGEGQDVHQWIDHKVGGEVNISLGDIFDEDQTVLGDSECVDIMADGELWEDMKEESG